MITFANREALEAALRSAGQAHHGYEAELLATTGKPDQDWPVWYSGYIEREANAKLNINHERQHQGA